MRLLSTKAFISDMSLYAHVWFKVEGNVCVGMIDLSVETQHTNPLNAYWKSIHIFFRVNNKSVIKEK